MSRWKPEARVRLEQAALELYGERGFEQTTVAEIAQRAGLTERTFFRHFTDKREVLFGGVGPLNEFLTSSVVDAPPSLAPIDAIGTALESVGAHIEQRRDTARLRQTIIDANADLQERELIKRASMASALAVALRRRGVGEPVASLAAEVGIAAFKIAYSLWISESNQADLQQIIRQSFVDLKTVTAAGK